MTRTRLLAATVLLAVTGLLLLPGTALATTTADVVQALLQDPVYVDPEATAQVDAAQLRAQIAGTSRPIFVAVLPAAAASVNGGVPGLTVAIGRQLGDTAILFTVAGSTLSGGAGSGSGLSAGEAARIAAAHGSGDLTQRLSSSIRQAASSAADGSSGSGSSGGGSGGGAGVLAVIAVLGIGGGGLLYARSRRRRLGDLAGSRADVESLYNRLGADVANLSPGADAVATQALADASERYTATGALLARSDTAGEFAAARRTAVEGLTAARLVRTRLGLDPGPDIPPPPGAGPQLQAAEQVQVNGQLYDGSPGYAPGRQHYFGGGYLGGQLVPGGWYGVPFWESMLLGSMLSGGYGGGGFQSGYQEGVEDARDASGGGGGDWGGGGGGGDWGGGGGGGGGGDWGGGGGGDWGGGGGGDSGGGSW